MEEKMMASLVAEALKPASSIVDALLRPRLERMRKEARRQELRYRLQDSRINFLLYDYLKRLLARVSAVKTLVFPEQTIPLTSIYEPLRLKTMAGKNFRLGDPGRDPVRSIKLGAKDLKPGHNYLIVDSVGMGKSTFAKYLVLDIIQSSIKIPLFLELRRIDPIESLLSKLSKELDPDQNDIDTDLLKLLLDQGEYVVILDGFDELTESLRRPISGQITDLALAYQANTLILTSRPEVGLPEIPASTVYGILQLSRRQAESLVRRYDRYAQIDVGERLIREFGNVSHKFLRTPLLLVLLYRTYGFNQSIATNTASFYNDVYNAFYKGHDLTKAGFSRPKLSELDQEDFRRLLRGFAFLLLTAGNYSFATATAAAQVIDKGAELTLVVPTSASNYFQDLLVAVPLVTNDGSEFRFIHKSIEEYFAAEYLAYATNGEKRIKMILKSEVATPFKEPLNYLLQLNPSLYRRAILAPAAKGFLSTQESISDPFIRTLLFCGVTRCGVARRGGHFDRTLLVDLGPRTPARFVIGLDGVPGFPSSTWRFLGKEAPPATTGDHALLALRRAPRPVLDQLLAIKWPTSISTKAFTKKAQNLAFRAIGALVLSYLQGMPTDKFYVFDDKTCRSLLKTISKERKAESQLDALILQSASPNER